VPELLPPPPSPPLDVEPDEPPPGDDDDEPEDDDCWPPDELEFKPLLPPDEPPPPPSSPLSGDCELLLRQALSAQRPTAPNEIHTRLMRVSKEHLSGPLVPVPAPHGSTFAPDAGGTCARGRREAANARDGVTTTSWL
jgi:hypothetical protein